MKISYLYIFILSLSSLYLNAQVFNDDQNPPSVKFRQINTGNFQVIYPEQFELEAQRMANTLAYLIPAVSKSLGKLPHPISIILQTQGSESNGFVQLAPRRSEFYTMPPQEYDPQDWLNSLAVHELRHVVQYDKIAGYAKAPLFEELALAIFGVNLPPWFFEGDAVGIETALSNAGRGRLPSFEMAFRANELSQKKYSYSKNYLGSVRDVTPGYYPLGYFMVSKIRKDYGPQILDSILTRISRLPFRPYNFSSSLKKYTGIGTRKLYLQTQMEVAALWEKNLQKTRQENYPSVNKIEKKIPANYLFPYPYLNNIISLKESKADAAAIVSTSPSGEEKLLRKIGFQNEANLNVNGKLATWDEFRYDARFFKRSFNVINVLDLQTGKSWQITHRTRLFSPSLHPGLKKLIAVQVSTKNVFNLVEVDVSSGKIINTLPNKENYILQTPSYAKNSNQVVVTVVSKQGKSLQAINLSGNRTNLLLPFQYQQLSRPVFIDDEKIAFKGHFNGLDEIFILDIPSKKIKQLTYSKFGGFNPSINQNADTLYFNNYLADGFHIAKTKIKAFKDLEELKQQCYFTNYFEPLKTQENRPNILDSIPQKTYSSKKYTDAGNLFYFHSLQPLAEFNDFFDDYYLGAQLRSDNKLNTTATYLGYRYNGALNKHEYQAGISYKKFFPVFSVNYLNRARQVNVRFVNGNTSVIRPVTWREHYSTFRVSFPLRFNRFNYSTSTGFFVGSSFTSRYNIVNRTRTFNPVIRFPMEYEAYFNVNARRSPRDLAPLWGYNLRAGYQHLPFDKRLKGKIFTLTTLFYLPGLAKNHSTQVSFNLQENDGVYNQNNDIPQVSGYGNLTNTAQLKNTLLLDYRFPIAYPDWEIGPLAYIKRFKGGLFTDFENLGHNGGLRTYGFEIRADMNLLRFYLPNFDIGTKVIFNTENKLTITEFGFNYNF